MSGHHGTLRPEPAERWSYSGVPEFIAETLSPSTAKRDKSEKKDILYDFSCETLRTICIAKCFVVDKQMFLCYGLK